MSFTLGDVPENCQKDGGLVLCQTPQYGGSEADASAQAELSITDPFVTLNTSLQTSKHERSTALSILPIFFSFKLFVKFLTDT